MTNGARHEWVANGGWQGGGAAKIFPITTEQGYNGLGSFYGLDTEQLNVRWLIRFGPDFNSSLGSAGQTKTIIFNRFGYRERPMIIGRQVGEWRTWGACDNTVCRYEGGDYWPDGTDSFRIGDPPFSRENEWISMEFSANSRTGVIRLYIYTQDGELSGLYVQQTMANTGGTFNYIDGIGHYFNDATVASAGNYFMIDEVVIDDSYIGPPDGFVLGNPPNPPILE
ncbi:MAG: hypothetical protein JAY67_22500 [Candidatus Thiodiazotropha taylori]|nr:hypothetical protein [Candidatus Thiodiazotropha taylori]MCG7928299.1 hypothetical protein [Candidatus Thiodiazotropha taylori]